MCSSDLSTHRTRGRSNTTGTRTSGTNSLPEGFAGLPPPKMPRLDTRTLGLAQLSQLPALPISDDTDIGGPPLQRSFSYASSHIITPLLSEMRRPIVTEECMRDPVNDAFYLDIWHTVAENNTKIFRQVFRCMPDNEVRTWKEYKEYAAFGERFNQAQGAGKSSTRKQQEHPGKTGPPGTNTSGEKVASATGHPAKQFEFLGEKLSEKVSADSSKDRHSGIGKVEQWAQDQEKQQHLQPSLQVHTTSSAEVDEKGGFKAADDAVVSPMVYTNPTNLINFPPPPPIPDSETVDFAHSNGNGNLHRSRTVTINEPQRDGAPNRNHSSTLGSKRQRRRATTKSSTRAFHAQDNDILLDKEDSKKLLELVQGHLVVWPYEWLEAEEKENGWLYTVDQIAPLEI